MEALASWESGETQVGNRQEQRGVPQTVGNRGNRWETGSQRVKRYWEIGEIDGK